MASDLFSNLFLDGPNRSNKYTNPRSGRSYTNILRRNRKQHGKYLREKLNKAWQEVEDMQSALSISDRYGTYLDFIGEPGYELMYQSLENLKVGIRLLNIKKVVIKDKLLIIATIFIPFSKRGYFLRRVDEYVKKSTSKKNNDPKHWKLVESISDIRKSVVESFWQDDLALMPQQKDEWVELWINTSMDDAVKESKNIIEKLGIEIIDDEIHFPERTVCLIKTNRSKLSKLVERSDYIAEFRLAKEIATTYIDIDNSEQTKIVKELIKRTKFDDDAQVSICILDQGINNAHLLLRNVLKASDMHAVEPQWGVADDSGHGTKMAGIATYGDLISLINSNNNIFINHCLESSKIIPPRGGTPRRLWGAVTAQGIYQAEIAKPDNKKIICMAITADNNADRGRPSSWSACLDELTSGYEDKIKRVFIVSSGSIETNEEFKRYYDSNLVSETEDPAQSWNALTVGAYTEKNDIKDTTLQSYVPIAPKNGLSPYSTTSLTWLNTKWPIKPEIVLEGANIAKSTSDEIFETNDLQLLTTYYKPQKSQFDSFGGTSAASAIAARMAAIIQSEYSIAWPETIRALIVHSADWTEKMKEQFLEGSNKSDYERLLRICGYGVPDLSKALYCTKNTLTLISQSTMQPYIKEKSIKTNELHLYDLPWPTDVLRDLGEVEVSMRVTLSYFIEPGPGSVGWGSRYRYPSHMLRFALNGALETMEEFQRRINKVAREEVEDYTKTKGPGDKWKLGVIRNVGSIHSDIWEGTAAELATSNKIAVYPVKGWWSTRGYLNRWDSSCRYSLVVSIETPVKDIDIYTPVSIKMGIPIEVKT